MLYATIGIPREPPPKRGRMLRAAADDAGVTVFGYDPYAGWLGATRRMRDAIEVLLRREGVRPNVSDPDPWRVEPDAVAAALGTEAEYTRPMPAFDPDVNY